MGWARAKALVETNQGVRNGWRLELSGAHVGDLIAPLYVEMFWVSYELVPSSQETAEALRKDETWRQLQYWSRAMNEYAVTKPFPAGGGEAPIERRFSMRRLYLVPASRWEEALCGLAEMFIERCELPLDERSIDSLELGLERMNRAAPPSSKLDASKLAGHIEQHRQETSRYLEEWAKRST